MSDGVDHPGWTEADSEAFADWGDYFVPHRQAVLRTCAELIPELDEPWTFMELACGAGLLSRSILETHTNAHAVCLDGSAHMRAETATTLAGFAGRFEIEHFLLEDRTWRSRAGLHAVVSSLAVHHLDGPGKRKLLGDLRAMLRPGGVFVLFDLCDVRSESAREVAATQWDEYVRAEALARDGNQDAFEFFARDEWNMYRFPPEPGSIDQPSTLNEHLQWGEAAGFVTEVHWLFAGHALITFRC